MEAEDPMLIPLGESDGFLLRSPDPHNRNRSGIAGSNGMIRPRYKRLEESLDAFAFLISLHFHEE